jgi:pimeloyl-ACP methyl ester carboxylesterase
MLTLNQINVRNNTFSCWTGGAGTPIVLIHGHNRSGDDLLHVAQDLARDHRVLLPDLRFHGRSGYADCITEDLTGVETPVRSGVHATIADLAQDVHALIEAAGMQQPVLLGHSLGGMIVMDYWRQYAGQARALVLDDCFPDFAAGMRIFDLFAPTVDADFKARVQAQSDASAATGRVPDSLWDSIVAFNARAWLPTINVPVLALLGDRGWIRGEQVHAVLDAIGTSLIPDVRVEWFADCGHFIALEQPERYVEVVGEFLQSI